MPACRQSARSAERSRDLAGRLFGAERIDVKGIYAWDACQFGGQLCREVESVAESNSPMSDVRQHATGQPARAVGHALVPQQRKAGIEPHVVEQTLGALEKGAQDTGIEGHLRLHEL